jgi:hypothetical protein
VHESGSGWRTSNPHCHLNLLRQNDCSLRDGPAQAERRPSFCLGIK